MTGVDVWLNTPEYPKEASGTSGKKAGINGGLNLSVTDGWWGEGYNGQNGWAITPHDPEREPEYRNQEEATELYELLEEQVVPLYYRRNGHGFSSDWVAMSKAAIKSVLPQFNAQRMLMDYVRDYYGRACRHHRRLARDGGRPAVELAEWGHKVAEAWPQVTMERVDQAPSEIESGTTLPITVAADLNGLSPEDVRVECLVGIEDDEGELAVKARHGFTPTGETDERGRDLFHLDLQPSLAGLQSYRLRMFPYHPDQGHLHETGRLLWL